MLEAEFICNCGFSFKESFLESEVSQASDLEDFYARCPRCGEEARPRDLRPALGGQPRRRDDS